jgi:hypothetical protein
MKNPRRLDGGANFQGIVHSAGFSFNDFKALLIRFPHPAWHIGVSPGRIDENGYHDDSQPFVFTYASLQVTPHRNATEPP